DGIRDGHVTGVQTCALPISTVVHFCAVLLMSAILSVPWRAVSHAGLSLAAVGVAGIVYMAVVIRRARRQTRYVPVLEDWLWHCRSEERRVGEEGGRRVCRRW